MLSAIEVIDVRILESSGPLVPPHPPVRCDGSNRCGQPGMTAFERARTQGVCYLIGDQPAASTSPFWDPASPAEAQAVHGNEGGRQKGGVGGRRRREIAGAPTQVSLILDGRGRANVAHIRQSGPGSGLREQVTGLWALFKKTKKCWVR